MKARYVVGLLLAMLAVTGCNGLRQIAGMPVTPEPTVNLKSAETRWLLIKNPRFGDVRSEPEYIWVEEDKLPTTMTTLLRGKSALIAPPEVVAKYGLPPGGGKISPRQGVPYPTVDPRAGGVDPRAAGSAAPAAAPPSAPVAQAPSAAPASTACGGAIGRARLTAGTGPPGCADRRGQARAGGCTRAAQAWLRRARGADPDHHRPHFVDGLRPGSVVSVRRDTIPLVHPVTGEVLGELDDEVGTARVTEIREKFSLAEVQSTAPGAEVQVRDRVVPK